MRIITVEWVVQIPDSSNWLAPKASVQSSPLPESFGSKVCKHKEQHFKVLVMDSSLDFILITNENQMLKHFSR